MIRKAKAVWRGTGRDGSGGLSTDSGVLAETPYSFIALAPVAAAPLLSASLQRAGYTPTELSTEAAVTLEQDDAGFRISRSALTLRAQVPNLDDDAFARMASDAEKNCPVSKILKTEITLDAKLT